jgi:hypothetical protein
MIIQEHLLRISTFQNGVAFFEFLFAKKLPILKKTGRPAFGFYRKNTGNLIENINYPAFLMGY